MLLRFSLANKDAKEAANRLDVFLSNLSRANPAFGLGADSAIISQSQKSAHGGIDLNTSNIDFQIKRDPNGIPLPVKFQNLENIHINGLRPIIINVAPIVDLPQFLGARP